MIVSVRASLHFSEDRALSTSRSSSGILAAKVRGTQTCQRATRDEYRTNRAAESDPGRASGTVPRADLVLGQPLWWTVRSVSKRRSVGVDDERMKRDAPKAGPSAPDVTFGNITFNTPLAIQSFVVEDNFAERSYVRYLDVDFNQSETLPTIAIQGPPASIVSTISGTGREPKNAGVFVPRFVFVNRLLAPMHNQKIVRVVQTLARRPKSHWYGHGRQD